MLVNATYLTGDLFRISYQDIKAVYENQTQLPAQTFGERIAQVLNNHIALLDTCLTIGQYAFKVEGLNALVAPFRLAAVAQGIYQLQSNPHADTKTITQDIILNLLNISRVAMERFSRNATSPAVQNFFIGAALACVVGDTAFRMHALYSNRTSLADKVKGYYDQGFSHIVGQAGKILLSGGDYVLRTAVAALFIFGTYFRGNHILKEVTALPAKTINEIIGWTALTGGLSLFISEAVHKIFNDMGLQPSPKRRFVELSFSTICSASLMAAAAVSLGRAASLSEIFKPISAAALTVTLACTLGYLLKTGASQFSDALGVPPGVIRELEEWTFTVLGSVTLTAMTSAGFGITTSSSASALLMFQTLATGLTTFFICLSFAAGGRTLLLGTPSWDELADWVSYIR